jgi:hypothetical protein
MKFVSRSLIAGIIWGLFGAAVVILPLYFYGATSAASYFFPGYVSSTTPIVPVGWLVVAVSLVSTFALADTSQAIKALVLSEIIAFTVSPLIFLSFPDGAASLSSSESAGLFGLLAVFFFLFGMAGSVVGSLLGAWVQEEPGESIVSLNRHRVYSLALILILLVGFSVLGLQLSAAAQAQSDVRASILKGPLVVVNQTLTWNAGTQTVWGNFTGDYGRGEIVFRWVSSVDLSLHYLVSAGPYQEDIFGPYSCGSACIGTDGILISRMQGQATVWFQLGNCPGSGCPSGSVQYLVTYWHY